MRQNFPRSRIVSLLTILVLLVPGLQPPAVHASGVVGSGTPASCTTSAFTTVLATGGTITFNCGPNPHTIAVPESAPPAGNTTIDGGGKITLSGSNTNRIFVVNSTSAVTLTNITLTAGKATAITANAAGYGGAIWLNAGTLTLLNAEINASTAITAGGALHNSYGTLNVTNSRILTNTSQYGGGISGDTLGNFAQISGSTIQGNDASLSGGGLYLLGNIVITNTLVAGNGDLYTSIAGGLDIQAPANVKINNSTIANNQSLDFSGGVNVGPYAKLTIDGSSILSNSVGLLTGNGVYGDHSGGGIGVGGVLTVSNSMVSGNYASGHGGGIAMTGGELRVLTSTMSLNQGGGGGMAILSSGSTVTMTIESSAVILNSGSTGGLYADPSPLGSVKVLNSTIGGNSGTSAGGLHLLGITATLTNTTIAGNTTTDPIASPVASALLVESGAVAKFRNTIFGPPDRGPNCAGSGTVSSLGFNVGADNTCNLSGTGDHQDTDPKLGPLSYNGGPTLTYYPASDSLARNGGGNPCPATDQRGAPRPQESACDIGAVELGFAPILTSLSPNTAAAGAAGFTLTLNGSKFLAGATALWNGSDRVTTFVSPSKLTAVIPTADLTSGGTALVSVRNAPGGVETSATLPFTISGTTGIVGTGSPGSCTGSALATVLNGGGSITFNCGPNPYTIVVQQLTPPCTPAATTIDGGGKIVLSGGNLNRLFRVNACSSLTLQNITLTSGYASTALSQSESPGNGGGIWLNGGKLTLANATIQASTAYTGGGAIYGSSGSLNTTNSRILQNESQFGAGGAILFDSGTMTVTGTTIQSNAAYTNGAVRVGPGAVATIANSAILSNTTGYLGAGGIDYSGKVTVANSQVAGNVASNGGGGGIHGTDGELTILASTIRSNLARQAGGIWVQATSGPITVTISSTSIITNSGGAGGNGYSGMALMSPFGGSAKITNSTIGDNEGRYQGIGLAGLTAELVNDTVANNHGINSLGSGSQLFVNSSTGTFRNTIIRAPAGGAACSGDVTTFVSTGSNIATDNSCALTAAGDHPSTDPKLGSLADNGGPTQTYYPAADSVARNGGSNCPATDQRGALRPSETACDIGAVEIAAAPALTSLSPNTSPPGGPAFTLIVNGNGFMSGSTIFWNGAARPTVYVSTEQLTASISAADIAAAGTSLVTVRYPAPSDGTSTALTFTITAVPDAPGTPGNPPTGKIQFMPAMPVNYSSTG